MRRVFLKFALSVFCCFMGDFVIPVPIATPEGVTIVYFLAVAGPCSRGDSPFGLAPLYFRRNSNDRRASFLPITSCPSRRQLGRLFSLPRSLCFLNFPRQFCSHQSLNHLPPITISLSGKIRS